MEIESSDNGIFQYEDGSLILNGKVLINASTGISFLYGNGGLLINNDLTINATSTGMIFVGMYDDSYVIIASGITVIINSSYNGLYREGCKGRFIVEGTVNIIASNNGLNLINNSNTDDDRVTTIAETGIIEITSEHYSVYITGNTNYRTDLGIIINGKLILNKGDPMIYDSMEGTGCISVYGGDCMPIS